MFDISSCFLLVCDNTVHNTHGYIASPNWPSIYPNTQAYPEMRTCVWKIKLPAGKRVRVRFIDFDFEESDACTFDGVEARDGSHSNSTLVRCIFG